MANRAQVGHLLDIPPEMQAAPCCSRFMRAGARHLLDIRPEAQTAADGRPLRAGEAWELTGRPVNRRRAVRKADGKGKN
jgi:hypothetical protein